MSTALEHRAKVRMARSMRTPEELRDRVPLFGTAAWTRRSDGRAKRERERRGIFEKVIVPEYQPFKPAAAYRPSLWSRIKAFIRSIFGA